MQEATADDFWLDGVRSDRRDLWAPPVGGPTILDAARNASNPDARLPDTDPSPVGADEFIWAPGALAGVLSHHTHAAIEPNESFVALVAAIHRQAQGNLRRADLLETYEALKPVTLATPRDVALAMSTLGPPETTEEVLTYTQAAGVISGWLICRGEHRGPVKVGLAVASLVTWEPLARRAAEVGRLTEFSAESCVLLRNQEPPAEAALLALGQWHSGWGRIHAVEALLAIESRTDQTNDWLFATGWDNHVHAGYTAPLVAGGVDVAERTLTIDADGLPDRSRLDAARGLMLALLDRHSPGAQLADIPGMLAVVDQWFLGMSLLPTGGVTIQDLDFARALGITLDDASTGLAAEFTGPEAARVSSRCVALLGQATSRKTVERALTADNAQEFGQAVALAPTYQIDPVPALLDRLSRNPDDLTSWFTLVSGHGPRLGVALIDFAVRTLPPGLVTETARMPGARHSPDVHAAVTTLWHNLGRNDPASGWRLVEALLRSRATPARHEGARWLTELPAPAVVANVDILEWLAAHEVEPDVRGAITAVLADLAPADRQRSAQPQPEGLVREANVLCWKGPKMGMTILTAKPGTLVLTTWRLHFRSRDGKTSHEIPLSSISSCTAGKKRALVVVYRTPDGDAQAVTFGEQLGMPDVQGWVAAIEHVSGDQRS